MNKKYLVLGLILLALASLIIVIYKNVDMEDIFKGDVETVDCYDNYNNKIKGLECEKDPGRLLAEDMETILGIIVFLFYVLGLLFCFLGLVMEKKA